MKLSIIHPILDSHEIVRRQILHYEKMNLPDNVEIILMDDGSIPPLSFHREVKNLTIYPTNDFRDWSEHIARNKGAEIASGEYVALIDIDYIIPRETIDILLKFDGDKMNIKRRFGILDKHGDILHDRKTLKTWGLQKKWLKRTHVPGHRSQFIMRKSLFQEIGGYREDLSGKAHPMGGGAGQYFFKKWTRWENKGKVKSDENKVSVFFFPAGKHCDGGDINYNPFGIFHNLSRGVIDRTKKTNKQIRQDRKRKR